MMLCVGLCLSRGLGFYLFAFLLTAFQADVHLVLLLHFPYFGQVQANTVPMKPVVTAATAYHEPTQSMAVIQDQKCSKHHKCITSVLLSVKIEAG